MKIGKFKNVIKSNISKKLFDFGQPREQVPRMVELAMERDGYTGDSFDPIADQLVQRHADFLINMVSASTNYGNGSLFTRCFAESTNIAFKSAVLISRAAILLWSTDRCFGFRWRNFCVLGNV